MIEFADSGTNFVSDLIKVHARELIDCTIPLVPLAWERTVGGRHKSKAMRQYQKDLYFYLKGEINQQARLDPDRAFRIEQDDDLLISIIGHRIASQRIDVDNFLKCIMDAGQPNIWHNDRQFIGASAWVFPDCDKNQINIRLWRLNKDSLKFLRSIA